MKGVKNLALWVVLGIVVILGIAGCNGYNGLVKQDESLKKSWNNVQTEYQKRADLVDQLVATVKGAANFEKSTLEAVINARANATKVQFTADQLTPENIEKFQAAQAQLSGSFSRLIAVAEQYPDLKANQNFLQLQGQVEGIENDVRSARKGFNDQVNIYNTKVRSFPTNIFAGMFGFGPKEGFKADEGAEKAPKIQF